MKRTYILFLIVAAIAMLLAASEVRAENGYPYPAISAPRTCTATYSDGESNYDIATIEAGPAFDGYDEVGFPYWVDGLKAQFPRVVICPTDEGEPPNKDCPSWLGLTGPYLRWDYRFTPINDFTPYAFAVSVSSDVEIDRSSATAVSEPGVGDSWTGLGRGMYEARILAFVVGGNSLPMVGYFITPVGFDPRVATAGAGVGDFGTGSCLLAGAGRSTLAPNQAAPDAQTFETPGCTVQFSVDPTGKAIPGTMQIISGGENCTIEETTEPVMIDGKEVVYVGPVQFTLPGSCKFCWVNTYGGKTCSNCTSCCIGVNSGTCQAITKVTGSGDSCM